MARVLYGVQGDAGGHVTRALSIARQLKGHEIVFVGGGRVAGLARHGYDTVEAPMLATLVADNRVDLSATIRGAIDTVFGNAQTFDRLDAAMRDFDPDLVLTDYEYFVPRVARRAGRACISVDRQHFLTNCVYPRPTGGAFGRALTLGAIRTFQMAASRYFVVSFTPSVSNGLRETEIFPPVLKPEILTAAPTAGEDALVYLYAAPLRWIREAFAGRRRRFIVYGQDREGEDGNLVFRRHDPDRFVAELASAAYVVSHGGHNLISECLHLGKPLLCFPIAMKYEQFLNGRLLADTGQGAVCDARSGAAGVTDFEASLASYQSKVARYAPWSDVPVASRLLDLLKGAPGA